MTFSVDFRSSDSPVSSGLQSNSETNLDSELESLYESALINYEQGRAWRVPPHLRSNSEAEFRSTELLAHGRGQTPWVKVFVSSEGLYEITGSDLEQLGASLEGIDPNRLRLFLPPLFPLDESSSVFDEQPAMTEIGILVETGDDGVFDPTDRIVFAGRGPDDWYSLSGEPPQNDERYYRDPYTNERVYWLTWSAMPGESPRRMTILDGTQIDAPLQNLVRDRVHLEGNGVYNSRPHSDGLVRELFFWRELTTTEIADESQRVSFQLPQVDPDEPVSIHARFFGGNNPMSRSSDPPPDHVLRLELNGHEIGTKEWESRDVQDFLGEGLLLLKGRDQAFEMTGISLPDDTISRLDIVLLAWIELSYGRQLVAVNDTLSFFAEGETGPTAFAVEMSTEEEPFVVDVTDPAAPVRILPASSLAGETPFIRFQTNVGSTDAHRFLVRPIEGLARPKLRLDALPSIGPLRDRTVATDMIVVYHGEFAAPAEDLARHRESRLPSGSGEVIAVDIEDIRDEFSFGRSDPTGLRHFLEFARARWNGGDGEGPAYVLLVGDANFDERNFLGADERNWLPTYAGYYDLLFLDTGIADIRVPSDDYFVLLEGPEDEAIDMAIGRLPAQTPGQARDMVDKIIDYETGRPTGNWINRAVMVADDLCQGTSRDILGGLFVRDAERLVGELPGSLFHDRLYLVEYGIECDRASKPDAAADLLRKLNEGALLFNYVGRGGRTQLADERVFGSGSVPFLGNVGRPFFFAAWSSHVSEFHRGTESLSEAVLRHPDGGAVATVGNSWIGFVGDNASRSRSFWNAVFPEHRTASPGSIGASLAAAKMGSLSRAVRSYQLLGDPAMVLPVPSRQVQSQVLVAGSEESADSLYAGQIHDVRGSVYDPNGSIDTSFEGFIEIEVFDAGSKFELGDTYIESYFVDGDPIYRGRAPVHAGRFETRFAAPAELYDGERGVAHLRAFATATDAGDVAAGSDSLWVSDADAPPSEDMEGPAVTISIEEGEAVLAESSVEFHFEDESGIDITGASDSRRVWLELRAETDSTLVFDLTDALSAEDDYRMAHAMWSLPPGLESGLVYEIHVRVSDNQGNASTFRRSFRIVDTLNSGADLSGVFNFPNPMTDGTGFHGTISQSAEVEVRIYSIRGREIVRLGPKRWTPTQLREEGIPWDGRDKDGDRLGNGVFFYRMDARFDDGREESVIERLAVLR